MRVIAELVPAGRPRVISILESGQAALELALAGLRETCRVTIVPATSSEHGLRVARRMLRRRCPQRGVGQALGQAPGPPATFASRG